MLQRASAVPHFEVTTVDTVRVRYATIWQRNNLVLVVLPAGASPDAGRYVSSLRTRHADLLARNAACVITHEAVDGFPAPAALVADRWGEIAHVWSGRDVSDLPAAEELIDWLDYLEVRCPECEGESR